MYAVEVKSLTKRFGNVTALEKISFRLKQGQVLVLLGPNGAGKSTLLKTIAGLYKPTQGTVRLFGDHYSNEDSIRGEISFVGENYALYDDLSVYDNLRFFSELYGISREDSNTAIKKLLKTFNATEYLKRKVGELSRGTKQKVAICRALLNNPKLLLLDEPTAFLDASSSEQLHLLLERLSKNGTAIIYATQRLDELYRISGNILMLNKGREIAYGGIEKTIKKLGHVKVELALYKELSNEALKALEKQWGLEAHGRRIIAEVKSIVEVPLLIEEIVKHGGRILSATYLNKSVEELMVHE